MSNIFRGLPYENDQKSIFFQICIQHPQSQFFHFHRVCYCHRAQIHFIHRLLSCGEFNSPFSTGSISYPESSGFLVSGATPGRLWGHRKNSIFLIGCFETVSIVLPQKSCGNKIRCPQSLPGVAPLTKKPEDSGYEIGTGSQSVCDTGYPCKCDLRVCMALKLNRNLNNNIPSKPTKNITKSEKAYPACFAVSSMLLSASKRCFERFSWEMVCVVCCVPKASRGLPLLGTF